MHSPSNFTYNTPVVCVRCIFPNVYNLADKHMYVAVIAINYLHIHPHICNILTSGLGGLGGGSVIS